MSVLSHITLHRRQCLEEKDSAKGRGSLEWLPTNSVQSRQCTLEYHVAENVHCRCDAKRFPIKVNTGGAIEARTGLSKSYFVATEPFSPTLYKVVTVRIPHARFFQDMDVSFA